MYTLVVRERPDGRGRENLANNWGGDNLEIAMRHPNELEDAFWDWLYCGPAFIQELHRVTGEFLAKKALGR